MPRRTEKLDTLRVRNRPEEVDDLSYRKWIYLTVGLIVAAIVILIFNPIRTVDAGNRGVLLTWGAVSPVVLEEGIHFVTPVAQDIVSVPIKTQKYQIDADTASKDLQQIITTIALNYHLDPGRVNWVYQTLGKEYQDKVIAPAIEEAVKASTAKFTAEELITRRAEAKSKMSDLLRERLGEYGIIVETVNIVNFQFSAGFNAAIEAKVTAEQNALTEKRKLDIIKFQAEQKVAQARGEADSKVAIAEAEAMAIEAIATAEAKSIEIQGRALRENPKLVELRAVEKWNGVIPPFTGGGGQALPIIPLDLGTLQSSAG